MPRLTLWLLGLCLVLLAAGAGCTRSTLPEDAPLSSATNSAPADQTNAVLEPPNETGATGSSPLPAGPLSDRGPAAAEPKPVPTVGQTAEAPVENRPDTGVPLSVIWLEAIRYIYRIDIVQHSTNQLPNTPEPATEEISTGLSYALIAKSPASDGSRELELELLAFDTEIRIGSEVVVKFDSAHQSDESERTPPIPQAYRNVAGSKVRLRVGPGGKVEGVLGYDEWVRSVAGEPAGPARQMLVQQFNPGFFQQLADFGRGLPDGPVSPGDHWPHHIQMPAGELGTITAESDIEFEEWLARDKDKFAVIHARGTLSSRSENAENGKPRMWIERGTVEGRSWFDPQMGVMVESGVEQSMRVRAETPVQPGESQSATSGFTSDIGQKVTVKLIEVKKGPN